MELIGITGLKRHGKSTAALALAEERGFYEIAFADPLKDMMVAFYRRCGLTDEAIEDRLFGALKETPDPILRFASPRWAMQTLGTEWRNGLNPFTEEGSGRPISATLWSEIARVRMLTEETGGLVVISDVRFPHEAELIEELGGTLIRVVRPTLWAESVFDKHASERSILDLPVHREIKNMGSAEDLRSQILDLYDNGELTK